MKFVKIYLIKKPESLKIVLDCGNGSAGCIAPDLFKKLGFNVIELFLKLMVIFLIIIQILAK